MRYLTLMRAEGQSRRVWENYFSSLLEHSPLSFEHSSSVMPARTTLQSVTARDEEQHAPAYFLATVVGLPSSPMKTTKIFAGWSLSLKAWCQLPTLSRKASPAL